MSDWTRFLIPKGPSEVMSANVDSVTVAKRSGGNRVEVQVFHVQVGVFLWGGAGAGWAAGVCV